MCGGNGVIGDVGTALGGFVKEVLPIAAWVAQPFMLGAGAGAEAGAGAGWVSAEGGAGYAGGAAADAAAAGGTAAVADGGGVGTVYGDGGTSETIPPLQDAGTGQVAGNAGDAAAGTTSPDYLKKAKDAASLAGAAAGIAKALTPTPTPPSAPAAAPPPQSAQSADISAILKKNSLLFGADSSAGTDLTKGSAGKGNLGKVSLLGGTSKLGG